MGFFNEAEQELRWEDPVRKDVFVAQGSDGL